MPDNPFLPDSSYTDRRRRVAFWRESYTVDESYLDVENAQGETVLVKMPCETVEDFRLRKQVSETRNYCAPIINKYVASIFRQYPARTETPVVEGLNTELRGGLQTFLSSVLEDSLVTGRVAVVAAATDDVEGTTLRKFDDASIMSTEFNDDGDLIAINLLVSYDEAAKTGKIRRYTLDGYADVEFKGRPESPVMENTPELTPLETDGLPVALVEPVPGSAFIRPIANGQVKITNLLSLLSVEITDNTFTRFVISGVRDLAGDDQGYGAIDPDVVARPRAPAVWSTKRLMTFEESDVKVSSLGAETGQADSIRASVKEAEEHLYRAAGVGANYAVDTGGEQSGVSRLVQLEDFVIYASRMIQALESAENHLLGMLTGDDFVATAYSTDVLDQEWADEIQRIRDLKDLGVIDDRVWAYMAARLVDRLIDLPDELVDILFNAEGQDDSGDTDNL